MAEGRVRWGVLGAAKIAREWVVPGIHMSDRGDLAAVASLTPGKAEALAAPYGAVTLHASYEALLADPGRRRDLHPAAEPPACRVDGEVPRGRQARALREADRAPGRGDRRADRAPRPDRAGRGRGLHGQPPPAMAPGARPARRRRDRAASPGAGRLQLLQRRPRQHPQPGDFGGGALRDIGVYPSISTRFVSGAGAGLGALCRDRVGCRDRRHGAGGGGVPRLRAWISTSRCGWRRGRS